MLDPLQVHELVHGSGEVMPDPIEFCVSDRYLDRANLYPRQATMLKVIFLREDLLTQYDHDVIGEWEDSFARTGYEGCAPRLLERMRTCREQGRPWFRETLAVVGRRGGKGHVGGLAGAYVLWNYMHRPGGPQAHYGLDRDKRLTMIVFAQKKEQAVANQWRDLANVIVGGPCFAPYVSRPQAERLTVFAPADMLRAQRQSRLGVESEADQASFEILAKESTLGAGRGPAAFAEFFDEMAHVVATGANRAAEDVYAAATPALDQFGVDAFLYEPSSPWQQTGQFYANWQKAIELEPDGRPAYPEMLMFQLPSWGPYEDWEEAGRIPLRPPARVTVEVEVEVPRRTRDGAEVVVLETREVEQLAPGQTFQPLKRAIQAYDDQMKQLERANPETFAVERRSRWAQSLAAYLDSTRVEEAFQPWGERVLVVQERGVLAVSYRAHGDPGRVNDSFGFAVAHVEHPQGERVPHVVFDVVHAWRPADFESGRVHYPSVEEDLEGYIERFMPDQLTFDQWNSAGAIDRLQAFVQRRGLPKTTTVYERTATRPINWETAETFKSAVNLGLVHAPMHLPDGRVNDASVLAELELRFLEERNGKVDHPSSGPVQSKDVADAMMIVVHALIGEQVRGLTTALGEVGVRGMAEGGISPYRGAPPSFPTAAVPSAPSPGDAFAAAMRRTGSPRGGSSMPSRGVRRR